MIFFFSRIGVVIIFKLTAKLEKKNSRIKRTYMAILVPQDHCCVFYDFFICSMMKLLIYFVIIIVEVCFKI